MLRSWEEEEEGKGIKINFYEALTQVPPRAVVIKGKGSKRKPRIGHF